MLSARRFFSFGMLIFISLISSGAFAQSGYLLALSKSEHVLAIIDPTSYQIVAKVPVGPDPHEIVSSPDGHYAYVSNMGGGYHEMDVIDITSKKALPFIDTKYLTGLHGLMFANGKLWFTAEGAKIVGRIDPTSSQVDWSMGTGQDRTHMIYATPDGKRVYTTNVNGGTVSILVDTLLAPPSFAPPGAKPRQEWIHTVIPVSKGSEGFDVTPDGKYLWTASSDGSISIVDVVAKKFLARLDAHVDGANRLKFTPDGKTALVSSLRSGDLFFIDVATRKEIKKISIGHGGAGILIEGNGARAFIGCTPDNYVAVVDLKKMELMNKISLGGPDGLAWAK